MSTAKKTAPQNSASADFEKSLAELEKIVDRMEKGDQTLDQTLQDFERGMLLSQSCQKSLEEAQLKVDKLIQKHGKFGLESMPDKFADDQHDDN